MTKLIILAVIIVIALIFAFVKFMKDERLLMWFAVLIAILCLSVAIPEAVHVANEYVKTKTDSFFNQLTR